MSSTHLFPLVKNYQFKKLHISRSTKNVRKPKSYVIKEKFFKSVKSYKEILENVFLKIVSFLRTSRHSNRNEKNAKSKQCILSVLYHH